MALQNRLSELLAEKRRRDQRRITMKEVAEACGVSRKSISKWFNNHIKAYPATTTAALIAYFDCTPNDFFVIKGREVAQ